MNGTNKRRKADKKKKKGASKGERKEIGESLNMLKVMEKEERKGYDRQVENSDEEMQKQSLFMQRRSTCDVHYPGYNISKDQWYSKSDSAVRIRTLETFRIQIRRKTIGPILRGRGTQRVPQSTTEQHVIQETLKIGIGPTKRRAIPYEPLHTQSDSITQRFPCQLR